MAVIDIGRDEPLVVTVIKLRKLWWPLLIPAILLIRFLFYRYASPLRRYPCPLLASGSRTWKDESVTRHIERLKLTSCAVCSTWSGHTETDHINIHRKYGDIVRIAPNELSFASPHAAREILAAGKGFEKTDFYSVFPRLENPDIFTETRESVHAIKKRYASNPYSMATMQTMSSYIEDTERLLIEKLDKMCQTPEPHCELGSFLHFLAFDVLGEIAFSRKFWVPGSGL